MFNRFDDHELKCVVISHSSTVRGLLSSVLKELGYTSITTVSDIKTCIEILETEPVAWVIAPVKDGNAGHVLHILNIIDKNPALRTLKVSILRDDDDSLIPLAFELGALSAHKIETSKEGCHSEFQSLLQRLNRYEGDCTRVAADYLARFLLEKKEFQELKKFYHSLLQIFPDRSEILLDLSVALFMAGERDEAKILLQRLLLTAPERRQQIEAIRLEHLPDEGLELTPGAAVAGHFGFKTCLILDSDSASLEHMKNLMQQVGFETVVSFQDPLQLMRWVRQNPRPDLVLSEWQLPNVPGPIFLYKLRNRLELDVPIVVVNRQITQQGGMWIKELGVSRLVAKPIVEKDLFQAIVWTMQQSKGPSDLSSLKIKLRFLSKRQDRELRRYRKMFFQHPMLIASERLLMEAQLAFDTGCYLHAKKYALDALKEAGDPRESLEILGKSMMKLREFAGALRCLENVKTISPFNVTYLCEIAECHLENGDDGKFESYLDQAKDLDPEATIVQETEAKGALMRGHTETARKLLQNLKSFKEVLAYMNNRAVALIQVGQHQDGLDLYKKALDSLPDGQQEVRVLLSYNLGLGLARSGRTQDAIDALIPAAFSKNPMRLKKVDSLRSRLKKALDVGKPLLFPEDPAPSLNEEESRLRAAMDIAQSEDAALRVTRSDYCVNKIYRSLLARGKAAEVLKDAPIFAPRGKLVKDYLTGISLAPN